MNKTALITGASSGIGLELAKCFATEKINLVLVARSHDKLNSLANELRSEFGIEVYVLSKDLGIYLNALEVFTFCKTNSIHIDYLVNNAGFGDYGDFAQSKWEKQASMINLNITTLTYLTHLFLPGMLERKFGRILNVASIASFMPGPLMSVYYATKAFVLHFSEGISEELNGTGVKVTALCPGPTKSGFQAAAAMENSKLVKKIKMPSSYQVAKYGFRAMMNGKPVAIPGFMNYLMANSIRFVPRRWVAKIIHFVQAK
jgi:short-subunit dehydrogenase